MNKLSNYTLHYNNHTDRWAAVPRGKEKDYWNENKERHKEAGILYSDKIETLMTFLIGSFDKAKV